MNTNSKHILFLLPILIVTLISIACNINSDSPVDNVEVAPTPDTAAAVAEKEDSPTAQPVTGPREAEPLDANRPRPRSVQALEAGLAEYLELDNIEELHEHFDQLDGEKVDALVMEYLGIKSQDEFETFMDGLPEEDTAHKPDSEEVEDDASQAGDDENQADDEEAPELDQVVAQPVVVNPATQPTATAQPAAMPEVNPSPYPHTPIGPLPANIPGGYHRTFVKHTAIIAPNGKPINIFAQAEVSDAQMIRARSILEFYLTNLPGSQYGADKSTVADSMANNQATLMLLNGADNGSPPELDGQPLYAEEMPVEGSPAYINNNYEFRDAAFEEILHLMHDTGIGIDIAGAQPGVLPAYQDEIRAATTNALPENEGLWAAGPEEAEWLAELRQEGSLTQEYLASVIDSYYGFWGPFDEVPGGMWGIYAAKTRADIQAKDPLGYALVEKFFSPYLTYNAHIDSGFNGTFLMSFDPSQPYTHKSQYLLNATLTGSNSANLTGNDQPNILAGNGGSNTLDGRAGNDTALFQGAVAEYTISSDNGTLTVIDSAGRDGTDTLINVEQLRFSDMVVNAADF